MRSVFLVALSLALVVLLEAIYFAVRFAVNRRREELRRRLQAVGQDGGTQATLLRRGRFAESPALDAFLRGLPLARRAEQLLEANDANLTVARLAVYSAAACLGVLALLLALRLAAVAVIFAGLAAPVGPTLALVIGAERRSRQVSEQLPEALDMMSRSLRAGHSSGSAFQLVATELPAPVSVEFARAFEEQRLGLPLEQAVLHMTERVARNRDLKIFATSVIIQKDTGGNLAELLSNLSETIRARYRFQGKLRALTAEGRASAVILSLLPLVFAFVLEFMNPSYLVPLVRHPTGQLLLGYALLSWVAGVVWLTRLMRIDV